MKHQLLEGRACLGLGASVAAAPPPREASPPLFAEAPQNEWKGFVQTTIQEWMSEDPYFAVYQGAHQFDGRLPDWSEAGIKRRAAFLRRSEERRVGKEWVSRCR